jgi:hypothetical protein
MPWLPFYASQADLTSLLAHLNASEEIAFVVSPRPGYWVAIQEMDSLSYRPHCLWHVPSGPLPLFRGVMNTPGEITNPLGGWAEVIAGADPSTPYFGAGHPGVFWLNVLPEGVCRLSGATTVGLSSFEWIGHRYKSSGSAAKPETQRWWRTFGLWMKKSATKVPRGGPAASTPPEIWAFPGARTMFDQGVKGGNN